MPDKGLVCDLMWSDPDEDILGWGESDRGVSYTFGRDVVQEFMETNNLSLICRAHQVVEDGYQFFNRRQVSYTNTDYNKNVLIYMASFACTLQTPGVLQHIFVAKMAFWGCLTGELKKLPMFAILDF